MGADEIQIGAAQLGLEAEYKDWEAGINKAIEALDRGENAIERFTEKGESEGRRAIRAQERVDQTLVELTGTTTERQLAAIDRKYARTLQMAKDSGADVAKVESAIYNEKFKLLQKEDQEYQKHVREIAGSNVALSETMKVSSKAFSSTAEAAEKTGSHFRQTQQATIHLGTALGGTAGEAGKAAGALVHLMNAAVSPTGIAIAALALTIGAVVKKHEEQAEAAKKAADEYEREIGTIQRWASEMAKLGDDKVDAELLTKQKEADRLRDLIANREEQVRNSQNHADTMDAAKDLPALEEKLRLLDGEIFRMNTKAEKEKENAAALAGTTEADRKAWEMKKKRGEEERAQDQLDRKIIDDIETEWMRTEQASEKATEVAVRGTKERILASIKAGEAIEFEVDALEAMGEKEALAVTQARELAAATNELAAATENAAQAAKAYTEAEARKLANQLYNAGMKQKDIRAELEKAGIDPDSVMGGGSAGIPYTMNDGVANDPNSTANLYIAAQGFRPGSIDIGAIMRNRQGVQLVVNNFTPAKIHAEETEGGVTVTIADDIMNGGDVRRALVAAGFKVG